MTDRIILHNMVFQGRHGVLEEERRKAQAFEIDVELHLNLRPAARADDIAQTIDYRDVYDLCRRVVEGPSCTLLEALAETIASELLTHFSAPEVVVRVRKPGVILPGPVGYAAVEVHRGR
jgi:FolB domain-containing protein